MSHIESEYFFELKLVKVIANSFQISINCVKRLAEKGIIRLDVDMDIAKYKIKKNVDIWIDYDQYIDFITHV